jgi:hypothetical protein
MKRLFTALIGVGLIASLYGYDKSGYYPDPLSLTGNGTISGSWTVGGNIFVSQRAKIGLDGASGNSYIMSDTGDIMKFYTNGIKAFEIGTSSITCNQTITMSAAKNVLLTGDSYVGLMGANPLLSPKLVFTDGNTDLRGGGWGTTSSLNMWVNSAEVLEVAASSVTVKQPLYIDSGLIANTYLRLKTFSTAELMGINPDVVGKLYYNSSTNKVCVSTGTTMGAFGSIAVGDFFK